MTRRSSVLEHDADRRLFAHLRYAGQAHAGDDVALAYYVREGYRVRWTYRLIGDALGISARRVSAIRHRDLARRGLL